MKNKQKNKDILKMGKIVKRIDGIESFERYSWNKNQKYLDFPDYIRTTWILKDTNFSCCNWMGKIHWEDLSTEDIISFEEVFESCPDSIKEVLIFNLDIFNGGNSKNFYGFVQR